MEGMFSYGNMALLEEFVTGREFRCGMIRTNSAELIAYKVGVPATAATEAAVLRLALIPVMLEYVMTNPDMLIRTATDKLSKSTRARWS